MAAFEKKSDENKEILVYLLNVSDSMSTEF